MKKFVEPEIDIIKLTFEDVIATSNSDDLVIPALDDDIGWG